MDVDGPWFRGGDRGDDKIFSTNMLMAMGQRGAWKLRSMLSLELATVGENGYPLLLQTGDTTDGNRLKI